MINQTYITKRVDGIAKDIHSIAKSLEIMSGRVNKEENTQPEKKEKD